MTKIIKVSGKEEVFSKAKLCRSLQKSGTPKMIADSICNRVGEKIKPGMSTTRIFRQALLYLAKKDMPAAARYSLRRGIAALGPAGFVFEQYIEALLQALEYTTRRDVIMQGVCVQHEIDVIAERNKTQYLLEMKYHNEPGLRTHIDTIMYADARLMDIAKAEEQKEKEKHIHKMWVVTNTEFTETAIKYAECRRIKLTGWNYPLGEALPDIIIATKTYPVTILPSITSATLTNLAVENIVLAQDLLLYTPKQLMKVAGVEKNIAEKILGEVQELFSQE